MGMFKSLPIPPNFDISEVKNSQMDGNMIFSDALAVQIDSKKASLINEHFLIEKRRYLQRFRQDSSDKKSALISYDPSEIDSLKAKLESLGLPTDVFLVKLPLWCPRNENQYAESNNFWPIHKGLIDLEKTLINPDDHMCFLSQVYQEKSVIIVKPGCKEVLAKSFSNCGDCMGNIDHGLIKALSLASKYSSENDGYLCTGYDVYCYKEPCCMCTMAMVHSRVERCFFIEENLFFGGIKSQASISQCPKINHRFKSYRAKYQI